MITFNLEMTFRSIRMLVGAFENPTATDATLVLNENALRQVTPEQLTNIFNAFVEGEPIRARLIMEID
jgi:hypothetical protein